eukprot:4372522-Prymnesium_polylepis.1
MCPPGSLPTAIASRNRRCRGREQRMPLSRANYLGQVVILQRQKRDLGHAQRVSVESSRSCDSRRELAEVARRDDGQVCLVIGRALSHDTLQHHRHVIRSERIRPAGCTLGRDPY